MMGRCPYGSAEETAGQETEAGVSRQLETEVIDQLLGRFVALVKRGLGLMLTEPSELVQEEFRQQPELVYRATDISALVL